MRHLDAMLAKMLAALLARMLAAMHPTRTVLKRRVSARRMHRDYRTNIVRGISSRRDARHSPRHPAMLNQTCTNLCVKTYWSLAPRHAPRCSARCFLKNKIFVFCEKRTRMPETLHLIGRFRITIR